VRDDKEKSKETGMLAMGILAVLAVLVLLLAISVDGMERFG
jgi:predicted nucleic acid-binding Zn ribbon protein